MLNLAKNNFYTGEKSSVFTVDQANKAREFHQKIDGYKPTPLVNLPNLAKRLGVKAIYVKDESYRFGLNAFKVLGGSYALGRLLAEYLKVDIKEIDLKTVSSKLDKPLVFATATAGNHGAGVAWAAQKMGQKAVVYMPKGSSFVSAERIRKLGAECIITDVNYDDTVRMASKSADENGWLLVQDTAWDGYEKIPNWIAQGYMTMADEVFDQLNDFGYEDPTHLFLQAGVGSMAGGVLGYFVDRLGPNNLTNIIAEPTAADCIFRSGTSELGTMVSVQDDLNSVMAGLACGEPSPTTWPILKNCSNYFAAMPDSVSAVGMRVLGNPVLDDKKIISGCSGAITLGLLYTLCNERADQDMRERLGLNKDAVIMLFSTEGDTNPELYRDIVWDAVL